MGSLYYDLRFRDVRFGNRSRKRPGEPGRLHQVYYLLRRSLAVLIVFDNNVCDSLCLSPLPQGIRFYWIDSFLVGKDETVDCFSSYHGSIRAIHPWQNLPKVFHFRVPKKDPLGFFDSRLFAPTLANPLQKHCVSEKKLLNWKRCIGIKQVVVHQDFFIG